MRIPYFNHKNFEDTLSKLKNFLNIRSRGAAGGYCLDKKRLVKARHDVEADDVVGNFWGVFNLGR